jgi:uncharacterized protein YbbC (DUF1343 family)/CubicO group peptidase (beta-lactamase class C family)
MIFFIVTGLTLVSPSQSLPASHPQTLLSEEQLAPIDEIVDKAIREGKVPGAVVIIGNREKIIYRRAFGYRSLDPGKLPMAEDTVFDMASLTKVVATTTAVMQLVEKRKLKLDAPVSLYWPAFKAKGKGSITVRHLLTHYSGLRPDLECKDSWSGYKKAIKLILAEKPFSPPGTRYLYSDINFEVLGELIRRVSGKSLDLYCSDHIFKPLGMADTGFRPSGAVRERTASTEYRKGRMLRGEVHDPTSYNMGGVAGHAGLFSTADDLSLFAQMLLNRGDLHGVHILSPSSIEQMTLPQSPPDKSRLRGLGWDLDAPFASNREDLFPLGSYGHLGYTGTALWIDPVTQTYIILLTNRVHPDGRGDVKELRAEVRRIVAEAIGPLSIGQVITGRPSLTKYKIAMERHAEKNTRHCSLRTGIDNLDASAFSFLTGLRVGLITNQTGLDRNGRRTVDLLHKAPGVQLLTIFSPEHGLSGTADEKLASTKEPITGLPVHSLYSDTTRPSGKMLEGLDALVFDIQDAGTRFYTYITTLAYALEAAAEKGIKFYVLDRPNPINASIVQGPVLDDDLKSFTGYFPLPVRHGMTVGELAEMFNTENNIGAQLKVIKMRDYTRTDWYDDTCLRWVNPSPNLRSLTQTILYPGVALAEGANVSVGRGTDTPFELLGAPWIDAQTLAVYLSKRAIQGVRFMPEDFTPKSDIYKNDLCHGVRILLDDRMALDCPALGIEIISALYKLYPADFQVDKTLGLIGSRRVLQAMKAGEDPRSIALLWQEPLARFKKLRANYLLY